MQRLPFGGYVQWVGDYFAAQWDASVGPHARFPALMRAMAVPHGLPWAEHCARLVDDSDAAAGADVDTHADALAWLAHAGAALCAQTRRYYQVS